MTCRRVVQVRKRTDTDREAGAVSENEYRGPATARSCVMETPSDKFRAWLFEFWCRCLMLNDDLHGPNWMNDFLLARMNAATRSRKRR